MRQRTKFMATNFLFLSFWALILIPNLGKRRNNMREIVEVNLLKLKVAEYMPSKANQLI